MAPLGWRCMGLRMFEFLRQSGGRPSVPRTRRRPSPTARSFRTNVKKPNFVAGDAWSRRLSALSIDEMAPTKPAATDGSSCWRWSRVGTSRGGGLKRGHPTRRSRHGLASRPPKEVDYDRILPGSCARRLRWLRSVVRIDQAQRKDDEGLATVGCRRGAGRPALVVNYGDHGRPCIALGVNKHL